jgi:hypothetical protein
MISHIRPGIAVSLAGLLCAGVIGLIPPSMPVPANYQQAEALLAGHAIEPAGFLPSGYTCFLFWCLKFGGPGAYRYVQGACYLGGLCAAAWGAHLLGLQSRFRWGAVGLLAVHPYWLLDIVRVNDNAVAAPLLCAFYVMLLGRGGAWKKAICLGATSGALLAIRPNLVVLVPVVVAALLLDALRQKTEGCARLKRSLGTVTLSVALMLGAIALANLSTAQPLVFVPNNGAYNLYAGTNPFTREYLLAHLNAELSLLPALKHQDLACEAADLHDFQGRDWKPVFYRLARDYAASHPGEVAKLVLVKFWTLFRPDYRLVGQKALPYRLLSGSLQTLMAWIGPVWVMHLLLCIWKRKPLERWSMIIVVLYCLPFLLTNADPRFRLPLDAIFILATASLLQEFVSPRASIDR